MADQDYDQPTNITVCQQINWTGMGSRLHDTWSASAEVRQGLHTFHLHTTNHSTAQSAVIEIEAQMRIIGALYP